jgi:hypothetical protein
LFTGPRSSRVDIVFVPNRRTCPTTGACSNYTTAADPAFLTAVRSVILNAYYSWDIFLRNQDGINFWIARDMGNYEELCNHTLPANWGNDYAFADAGAIVHDNVLRDCARHGDRIFSSEPTSLAVFLHETGHSPFGLADEYCCDGGYFQSDPLPNLYRNIDECRRDIGHLQEINPALTAAACREVMRVTPTETRRTGWFVSDPTGNELMEDSGNHTPGAADERRIEWIFSACKEASCMDLRP